MLISSVVYLSCHQLASINACVARVFSFSQIKSPRLKDHGALKSALDDFAEVLKARIEVIDNNNKRTVVFMFPSSSVTVEVCELPGESVTPNGAA